MAAKVKYIGTYEDIENLAARTREIMDDRSDATELGEKLKWLVNSLSGEIGVVTSPDTKEDDGGSLVVRADGRFSIYLSPYTSPLRDNFTIGHEIGHYLLHCDLNNDPSSGPLVFNRFGSDRQEWQANRFAAALLMPQDKFQKAFNDFDGNISALSGYFGVSGSAAKVRAISLGLIEE